MSAAPPTPARTRTPARSRLAAERGLVAVAVLALACGALAATVDVPAVRIPAGLVLELLLPGYALSAFALARRELAAGERLLASVGASLVVSALGGLLLDGLPGHMGRSEWAAMLTAITLAALIAAIARPPAAARAQPMPVAEQARAQRDWFYVRWAQAFIAGSKAIGNLLLALLALGLAVAAVAVARHAADRAPGFTELSALPAGSGSAQRLEVEVRSHQPRAETYNLSVREDGRLVASAHILLAPGGLYRLSSPPLRPAARRVRVALQLDGSSRPYLHTLYYPHGR